jgi:hypothetical protein
MNSNKSSQCTCTVTGYAPDCPQAFMQNGVPMHTLTDENQLKPKMYGVPEPLNVKQTKEPRPVDPFDYIETAEQGNDGNAAEKSFAMEREQKMQIRSMTAELNGTRNTDPFEYRAEKAREYKWMTDSDMKQNNRKELPTFTPLEYQGVTMTEATIGGYRLNMEVAQRKATEFVPLPPVFLPIIFVDKNLNFSHQFFQGMDLLLGKEYMNRVVSIGTYSGTDSEKLLPDIKSLITSGSKATDTELTFFVKRVLSGTFDTLPSADIAPEQDELIVALNMWGFQYLEPGMRCRDADLKMWLHMSYIKYKVSWFNAFKSSSVPQFAMTGVQDKFEKDGPPALKKAYTDDSYYYSKDKPRKSRGSEKDKYYEDYRSLVVASKKKPESRRFF